MLCRSTFHDHSVILLDSRVWIYYFENHPRYADMIEAMLTQCLERQTTLLSSELTLLEIKVGPLQVQRREIAAKYELRLDHYPNLPVAHRQLRPQPCYPPTCAPSF